jgi:energy-coupling factor transporter ATP-binding protein EcfA2
LKELSDSNHAVIVVTHDVEFATLYADRVILMAGGKVTFDGRTRDVLSSAWVKEASLIPSQAAEIGNRLGVNGVLSVEEVVRGSISLDCLERRKRIVLGSLSFGM